MFKLLALSIFLFHKEFLAIFPNKTLDYKTLSYRMKYIFYLVTI